MKRLRKSLIVSVMSVTVISMSMLMVPFSVGAAAAAGDLIKMDGLSSVYYLAADGKRYVFPNETTYFSWYSDFTGVVPIPQSELESYPLGANVTMRPGTYLVKITTDPKVYAVEPNGSLLWVPDETTAVTLWGADWAGRVVDVPDAFFTNYTISANEVSATAYTAGSLIKWTADPAVYWIDADGSARKFADEAAFLVNRFKWGDIITAPESVAMPTAGADVTGEIATVTDTSSGAGGTAGAGTGLTVSIASDTPEAGNIPAGSPNDFLKLNFIASADGSVSINSVKLTAYDLGTATFIDSVTFYDNGVKQGNAKNMNSDREAIFNFSTPIEIAAGATKSLLVKATIQVSQAGNFALGIASASDVVTNGAVVSGSFPITGNTKAIVTGVTIGAITMSSVTTDAAATADFGEDNVLLAAFSIAAANEPIIWESASFRNAGTNNATIVSNMKLLIDGDEAATSNGLVDKYASFSLDNYLIAKNDTITVEVYGDMGIANVGNTINLYVKDAPDLAFTGQDFGYGILPTIDTDLDVAGEGILVTLAAGDFTIDMDKSATPSKDVRGGDTDVVLATIKMTSNGESATTDGIKDAGGDEFIVSGTGLQLDEIDNVEMKDVDTGVIYDITPASTSAANIFALTLDEEISFVKGVTKTFELRCDIEGPNDADPIEQNDTLRITLESGALTLTGDESDASITNITPSSVTSAIATVKSASLTWTTVSLTDKKVVPGAEDVIVYRAGLEVGESSSVKLQSVQIDVIADDGDISGSFLDTNISKLDLYIVDSSGDKLLKTRSNAITEGTATVATDNYINFTSLDSTNRVIAAGTDVYLELRADFTSSFATTSTWSLGIDNDASRIVAKDQDNNNVGESVVVYTGSRDVTLASAGTLKVELKIDDTKANSSTYLLAGAETTADRYMGELVFTTANEPIKVKTLVLGQVGSVTGADISAIKLYDKDGAEVASQAPSALGHANFDTFNYTFSADQATSLFIGVVAKSINADGDPAGTATFNRDVTFTLASEANLTNLSLSADEAVTAIGVESGEDVACIEDTNIALVAGEYSYWGDATTTDATITGSVLNSVVNDMSDTTLTAGNNKTIGKYKFVFDNGANRATTTNEELKAELVTLVLTIATSTNITATGVQAYIEGDAGNKTTIVPIVAATSQATIDLTGFNGTTELVDGTITLVIIADVGDSSGTGEYLQTSIADLVGSGDFTYNGNNNYMSDFDDVRLDIAEVIGATLSN